MIAIIAVTAICSILASVLVITASMLSSRLSRVEDHFWGDEIEVERSHAEVPAGDNPPQTP